MIIGLMMAKNNSVRLKNKNLKYFANGYSLFEFSLKENLSYPWFDEFFVISNCKEVEKICKKYPEVIFIKEPEILAKQDNSYLVIKFLLKFTGLFPEDLLVLVPTTAPLRTVGDIKETLKLITIPKDNRCTSIISVSKCKEPPEWSFKKRLGYLDIRNIPMTSQELTPYYHLNGSIYISRIKNLEKYDGFFGDRIIPYIMPYNRSVDIDNNDDFELAQYYYKKRKNNE